jgi:hypothetical protein
MRREKPLWRASLIRASILVACLIVPGVAAGQALDRASLEALARKVLPATASCNNSASEVLCWYEQDDFHASFRGGRYNFEPDGPPAVTVVVHYNDRSANNDSRLRLPLDIGSAFGYRSSEIIACLDRAKQVTGSKQPTGHNEAQDRLPRIRSGAYELSCDFEMPRDQAPYTDRFILVVTAPK